MTSAIKSTAPQSNTPARKKSSTVGQLFTLLWQRKAWWLVPMVSVFLVLGLLLFMTAGSALSPFIYALF